MMGYNNVGLASTALLLLCYNSLSGLSLVCGSRAAGSRELLRTPSGSSRRPPNRGPNRAPSVQFDNLDLGQSNNLARGLRAHWEPAQKLQAAAHSQARAPAILSAHPEAKFFLGSGLLKEPGPQGMNPVGGVRREGRRDAPLMRGVGALDANRGVAMKSERRQGVGADALLLMVMDDFPVVMGHWDGTGAQDSHRGRPLEALPDGQGAVPDTANPRDNANGGSSSGGGAGGMLAKLLQGLAEWLAPVPAQPLSTQTQQAGGTSSPATATTAAMSQNITPDTQSHHTATPGQLSSTGSRQAAGRALAQAQFPGGLPLPAGLPPLPELPPVSERTSVNVPGIFQYKKDPSTGQETINVGSRFVSLVKVTRNGTGTSTSTNSSTTNSTTSTSFRSSGGPPAPGGDLSVSVGPRGGIFSMTQDGKDGTQLKVLRGAAAAVGVRPGGDTSVAVGGVPVAASRSAPSSPSFSGGSSNGRGSSGNGSGSSDSGGGGGGGNSASGTRS